MNGTDRTPAESRPALLARLQATMPADGLRPLEGAESAFSQPPSSRLHQTRFAPVAPRRDSSPPMHTPRRPVKRSRLQLTLEAVVANRWLITGLLVAGGILGYIYTALFCIPLYHIQASLEVTRRTDSSTETLAHVLESQSLMQEALASLSEQERSQLVQTPRFHLFTPRAANERLHERLNVVPIPSALVIDIDLISPSRSVGVSFLNALIHRLLQRNREQQILGSVAPIDGIVDNISIIDPAIADTDPAEPNVTANVLVGFLVGILTGLTFALIRTFATNTFAGPGSVSRVLGVRELGAIPERKLLAAPGAEDSNPAIQIYSNDESLRYLRSSLLYQPGGQELRNIAFTSAAPGEGKTTVVSNLSMSLAATGRRVLVVDGDLRRPRLHKLLQVPPGPGLSDLLRRDPSGPPAILSKFVVATAFANLYVLPPGSGGDDAPELLAGPLLGQLIRDLSKSFDFVLIDTPPLLACADARNYSRAVEGVVLVVRSSETQKRAALVARDMLLQDGANIIGTVLTGWRQTYPAYNYPAAGDYTGT